MQKLLKTILVLVVLLFPLKICNVLHPTSPINPKELQKEIRCIEEMLWHEARGEGEEGMRAVLSVVDNRKNNSKFPSTYCKVINQPGQFSYIIPGKVLKQAYKGHEQELKGLIQDLSYEAATGSFKNSFASPEVLWYHRTDVKPSWSRKMQKVKTVKQHGFFKLKE